ncbi:MAG: hypothetical protein WBH56_09840, partial [Bacteroidota bacterium]
MNTRIVIGVIATYLLLGGAVAQAQNPDLYISTGTPTATPSTVAPGGTVTLSAWTVRNQGGTSTGVGFSNGFYLSTNSTI